MNSLHYIVWQGFLEDNTWPVLWNLACSQHNVGFYYYRWFSLCWCKIRRKYGQNGVTNALLGVSLWGARYDYQCVIAWRGLKCHVRQLTMNWKMRPMRWEKPRVWFKVMVMERRWGEWWENPHTLSAEI